MRKLTLLLGLLPLSACERGPAEPPAADTPAFASTAIQRPVHWTVMDLKCPDGSVRSGGSAQWQSIVPLDERGDVILVGGSDPAPPAGCQGREDWFVYDLSSSQPVLLDAINTGVTGFNIGVHSPRGSSVGFGVEGNVLAVYDGGFRTVSLPITALAVWAASPTEVWIGGGSVAAGRIVKYDGSGTFVVEHAGGGQVWSIWGYGPTARFARGLTGILERNPDGTWTPMVLPADCDNQTAWGIVGRSPNDVWTIGSEGAWPTTKSCLLHYDGNQWMTVAAPAGGAGLSWVWPLAAQQVLVAGQQVSLQVGSELIALWGSADAGETWTQFADPQFSDLGAAAARGFFALGITQGGNRIFAPTIVGGRLLLGTPQDVFAIAARRSLGAPLGVLGTEGMVEPLEP